MNGSCRNDEKEEEGEGEREKGELLLYFCPHVWVETEGLRERRKRRRKKIYFVQHSNVQLYISCHLKEGEDEEKITRATVA